MSTKGQRVGSIDRGLAESSPDPDEPEIVGHDHEDNTEE